MQAPACRPLSVGRPLAAPVQHRCRKYGVAATATLEEYESPMMTQVASVEGETVIEVDATAQDESLKLVNCGLLPETVKVCCRDLLGQLPRPA